MEKIAARDNALASQGDVGARLRQLVAGRATLDVGQLRFIGMEKVAAAYGDTWTGNRSEALDTALGIIVRNIGPKDVVARGDDGFVVISGGAGPGDAERLATTLSAHIDEYFLGAPGAGAAPATPAADSDGDVDFFGPDEAVKVEGEAALTAFDWRFQPVWDVKREALGVWSIVPYQKGKDEPVPGYLFDTFSEEQGGFEGIDETALLLSEQAIRRLVAANQKAIVGVSLHVTSLVNGASRTKLVSLLERFGPETARYRLVKIAGIRPGFPRMYLNEIVGAVRARAPNLSLTSAWTEPDIASIAAAGPATVGFSLSRTAAGEGATKPHTDLLAKVRAAVQIAHAARKPFIVEGMFGRPLARELVSLGVDGLSSPTIWRAETSPQPMQRWSAAKLAAF